MAEPSLIEAVRSRLSRPNFGHLHRLATAVGATLAVAYIQLAVVHQGGENPWSLLAPATAPVAIWCFVVGWARARPWPWAVGIVLALIGGVLPFALIG